MSDPDGSFAAGPAAAEMKELHHAAAQGFADASAAYSRGRPDYPRALQEWLPAQLPAGPGTRWLDLGAGTGKFTQQLVGLGAEVLAMEPVAAMRGRLQTALPELQVLDGRAEAMPLPDASVDAIVCAQAFHWFANAAALQEMHRVLRPGGRLLLVWNVRDASVDWVTAITEIISPYEGDAPRHHSGRWRTPFADQAWFGALQRTDFPHTHEGSFDEVIVDRFLSVSFIAALPEAQRRGMESQLRALPQRFAALRAPRIAFPYRTEAWVAKRLD